MNCTRLQMLVLPSSCQHKQQPLMGFGRDWWKSLSEFWMPYLPDDVSFWVFFRRVSNTDKAEPLASTKSSNKPLNASKLKSFQVSTSDWDVLAIPCKWCSKDLFNITEDQTFKFPWIRWRTHGRTWSRISKIQVIRGQAYFFMPVDWVDPVQNC